MDLAHLLNKTRGSADDEGAQKLGIVSKDGVSYLAPIHEQDVSQIINGYSHWEQAFRVFLNILTTKYPFKATELLQYNHTIHSAATIYIWDNVYAYDKEFRYHISCHLRRSWE